VSTVGCAWDFALAWVFSAALDFGAAFRGIVVPVAGDFRFAFVIACSAETLSNNTGETQVGSGIEE
jgi:hypothetical protein